MATVQLEIISRQIIQPSSPTPTHLRNFSLSFFDQSASHMYVPVVLFYNPCNTSTNAEKSNLLKKSLSETLALYYHFAGRIKDREYIDCNDEGIVFLEAKINLEMPEILNHPKLEILDLLFADSMGWKDSKSSSFVAVQVTFFECGGMAISVCMSHKLGDAATMVTFINDWASKASNSGKQVSPLFNTTSMFPKGDLPLTPEHDVISKGNLASRRFVFDASKIAALKSMVVHKVQSPTKVEVVSALLYKCAISASKASSGTGRPTLLQNSINMRSRLVPPVPEKFVGNLAWFCLVPTAEDGEIELHSLVSQMKEALAECNTYVKKFRGDEWFLSIREAFQKAKELVKRKNQVQYIFSSWCRFPIYQADFGFGKPVWVSIGSCVDKNVIILMDTSSGDGIEAFVTLEEQDMVTFEHDEELLEFATFNPSPSCFDDLLDTRI